jgi:hypothetical protein
MQPSFEIFERDSDGQPDGDGARFDFYRRKR